MSTTPIDFFKTHIKDYLIFINDKDINPIKKHILYLEGSKDKERYQSLLDNTIYNNGKPNSLSFKDASDKNIKFAFDAEFKAFLTIQEIDIDEVGEPNKALFVKECLTAFNELKIELDNIDLYGFVDRDYEQNAGYLNLKETSEHDFETNLISCYFDLYFEKNVQKSNYDKAADIFSDILYFCAKQGVLGKACYKFISSKESSGSPYTNAGSLIGICHKYFKDNSSIHSFVYPTMYNFDTCLSLIDQIDNNFRYFYLNEDEYENIDYDTIRNDVENWLVGGFKISSVLKKCLRLANGHILIGQLIQNEGKHFFGIDEEDSFVCKLLNYSKTFINRIFNLEPLCSYKQWRIDNDYIY